MNFFLLKPRKVVRHLSVACFVLCALLLGGSPALTRAAERFPLYPCIRPNVQFWENVYSRYSTRQGIIHDSEDLSRVYTVVDLVDWEASNSARINEERIKAGKERIAALLAHLGSGSPPRTAEERKISQMFPNPSPLAFQEARDNLRLQIGQSDRFYEGVLRSGKYLAHFQRIFQAQGLPLELAYLPHVESSFNPKAYSKAGAAGLWQFTRSTGKDYMTINDLVDERLDPYVATEAAAQLLKDNYAQLQSWPLALTAYNHGRAGMLRAVREKGSYESVFKEYDQGAFKFASRNFYAEFLAAARVAMRLGKNSRLPMERPESIKTLTLKDKTSATRLRAAYGLSTEQFARLNPALMDPVLEGRQAIPAGVRVRLPATTAKAKSRHAR